ncbi:hypothetical protein BB560_006646 [Smittium megazygosporum]|uniref:Uncharacterized protein n=1 Tax=Smittium megazygosporum TaxID=133381 RepID=A0A2T9Y2N5_9FUNG|nr:hypothetical protein BB560_006646 [Smittium megazygosporum]
MLSSENSHELQNTPESEKTATILPAHHHFPEDGPFDEDALFSDQDNDRRALQSRFIDWDKRIKALQTKIVDTLDSRLLVQSELVCQLTDQHIKDIRAKEKKQENILKKLSKFASVLQQLQNSVLCDNDSILDSSFDK